MSSAYNGSTGHKYGARYFGPSGFFFKKYVAGGTPSLSSLGRKTGIPIELKNVYVPGSGVGSTSIAARRAKMRRATETDNPKSICVGLMIDNPNRHQSNEHVFGWR